MHRCPTWRSSPPPAVLRLPRRSQFPEVSRFSATIAGIKASGRPDLALAEAPHGASAAAVFTRNRLAAAPLVVDRAHLKRSSGRMRAVLVNAGNANCATGKAGVEAAESVCRELGSLLEVSPEFIFPSSTGIIGVPLPAEKIVNALPAVLSQRAESADALLSFAQAIMTTDLAQKLALESFKVRDKEVRLAGVAKGSGMIHPNLATMLVYLFTDIEASPAELQSALKTGGGQELQLHLGRRRYFHQRHRAAAGQRQIGRENRSTGRAQEISARGRCRRAVRWREQIVRDGEGAKHLIRLQIEQAKSTDEARIIARSIANSPLVKTAWAGCDPNWGRILSSIGNSGIALDPGRISVFIGPHQVCRDGQAIAFDKPAAHQYMTEREYEIRVQLGRGKASLTYLSCDLTTDYVHINADYST